MFRSYLSFAVLFLQEGLYSRVLVVTVAAIKPYLPPFPISYTFRNGHAGSTPAPVAVKPYQARRTMDSLLTGKPFYGFFIW